jgi:16S rRNA G1207 methylase RsmC
MTTDEHLADLAAQEEELMHQVKLLSGSMQDLYQQVQQTGICARYAVIHAAYVALAAHSEEALKRAIFIQWYAWAEPECFTGIFLAGTQETATKRAEQLLHNLVLAGELDEEWRWMLPWYYRITDYAFGDWTAQPVFQQLLTDLPDSVWTLHPALFSLESRGQMGRYWLSIQESHARHRSMGQLRP